MKQFSHSFGSFFLWRLLAASALSLLPLKGQEEAPDTGTAPETLEELRVRLKADAQPSTIVPSEASLSELLRKHERAHGGYFTLADLRSYAVTGTIRYGEGGMRFPFDMLKRRPNLLRINIQLGDGRQISQGFNGEVAWAEKITDGTIVTERLSGPAKAQIMREAEFESPLLRSQSMLHTIELLGETTLGSTRVYVIRVDLNDGGRRLYYLDTTTLLEVRIVYELPGLPVVVTHFGAYQEFDEHRLPSVILTEVYGGGEEPAAPSEITEVITRIDGFESNLGVLNVIFDMPR